MGYSISYKCAESHPNECLLGNCGACWWDFEESGCIQCDPPPPEFHFVSTSSVKEYLTEGGTCAYECDARNYSLAKLKFTKLDHSVETVIADVCFTDGN